MTQTIISMKAITLFKIKLLQTKIFWFLVLFCLASPSTFAAQINVSVDRNPVSMDESFQITFSANEEPDGNPDFSPLEEDFQILNQSQSSSSSWINGKSTKAIQWTLNVMAKQAGNLIIPEIKFGNDASQTLGIDVTQGPIKKDINTEEDLFLEVEATPNDPYVQSQVIYTMRLYVRVNIAQASLNEPEIADAVIEKLGEDSKYNAQLGGIDYSVIERRYAIFPQKSGQLTIKPLTLTAEVIINSRPSFSGFFNSQATKTRSIKSKPIVLNVRPAPAAFTGSHWLSAEQLVLKQEWSGDNQQIKVGEPLTRTLSLMASGTTVGQLPELNTSKTDDYLKSYPDQPVLKEQKNPEGIVAFREEKIALILSKPGSYKLPAIKVHWFNTRSQKIEEAAIPETTITAVGTPGAQIEAPKAVEPSIAEPQTSNTITTPTIQNVKQTDNTWLWVSVGLTLGWLTTIGYFLFKKKLSKPAAKVNEPNRQLEDTIKKLKRACTTNDARAAKDALINWGRQQFNTTSLGATATLCDARLRDEMLHLNQILYSQHTAEWQGKKLLQVFIEQKASPQIAQKDQQELEPLYRL